MKKFIYAGLIAAACVSLTSCDDFLDKNRYPEDQQVNNSDFWSNESNVSQEADLFYNTIIGYGYYWPRVNSTASTTMGEFYFKQLSDDQVGFEGSYQIWPYTNVPNSAGDYNYPYINIRQAMSIIDGVNKSSLSEEVKANYIGIARLNRALNAFNLVKRYGDIIWVDEVVDLDSEVLYGERTDRDIVMDYILEDLDYAIAHISTEKSPNTWSKNMARAAKAEICLYEGTYCKYRTQADNGKGPDMTRSKKYLEECVKACEPLMSTYSLAPNYSDIYKSMSVSSFLSVPEIILGKSYAINYFGHAVIAYTSTGTTIGGITKDAFDSFLFIDGKPLALTSCDTNDAGVWKEGEGYYIGDLLSVRDGRLAEITDDYSYCIGMTWSRDGSDGMSSTTGYGVRKFDPGSAMELYYRRTIGQNYTCAPIYWLSAVLCEYAEAKAELGTITQSDIDKSINKLYARAGLPDLQLAGIFHDPANNVGVSDIIWEARRCRRCELIMDRDFRYWDLVRWHMLDKLDNQNPANINTILGANMVNAPAYTDPDMKATLKWEGTYINGATTIRTYDKKYYFYPIPSGQLTLNTNLKQNPGW